jgi:ABC-2 type transport system permease protein
MLTIFKRELSDALVSVRSIILLVILFLMTSLVYQNKAAISIVLSPSEFGLLILGVALFMIGIFMFLTFTSSITQELANQTIRYIVPYLSRTKYLLAKYFSMVAYGVIMVILSMGLDFFVTGTVNLKFAVTGLGFVMLISAIMVLISLVAVNVRLATFSGILMALGFPILTFWASTTSNKLLSNLQYLSPYRYLDFNWWLVVPFIASVVLMYVSQQLFVKKAV